MNWDIQATEISTASNTFDNKVQHWSHLIMMSHQFPLFLMLGEAIAWYNVFIERVHRLLYDNDI
jgi:hypothetical protein